MDTSCTDDAQQATIQNDSSTQESAQPPISSSPSPSLNPFHNVRIFLDVCAGRTRPLSAALKAFQVDLLSFDILLDPQMNLLDDAVFLQLLKLCASGVVAYGAFSPSCGEYSRLKLRPGGPPPLRDPEHLDGLPGLDCHSTLKLQNSFTQVVSVFDCFVFIGGTWAPGAASNSYELARTLSTTMASDIRRILYPFGSLCIWSQLE